MAIIDFNVFFFSSYKKTFEIIGADIVGYELQKRGRTKIVCAGTTLFFFWSRRFFVHIQEKIIENPI